MYRAVLALLVILGSQGPISASAQEDPEHPPQALVSDPAPPLPRLSITVDPVGAAFGEWSARISLAPLPAHAVFVEGGYRATAFSPGIGIELGYQLFFLGGGLDGPFVGLAIGAALTTDRAQVSVYGAFEVGWQIALGPFALGLAGGLEGHTFVAQPSDALDVAWAPRVTALVGYALK